MIALFASFTLSRIRLASSNCSLQVGVADVAPRVLLHRERLRLRAAVDGQPRLIGAGQHRGAVCRRAPEHHAREAHDRLRLQIPAEALDAGRHRRRRRAAAPAPATFFVVVGFSRRRRLRRALQHRGRPPVSPARPCASPAAAVGIRHGAVERPHHLTLGVEDVELQLLRWFLQPVRDASRAWPSGSHRPA